MPRYSPYPMHPGETSHEYAFKQQLRAATTLMSFEVFPVMRLKSVAYPSDDGLLPIPLTLKAWQRYKSSHDFVQNINCFCSIYNGISRPVRIFEPVTHGKHRGKLCLGCAAWTPKTNKGCKYFVNLVDLFDDNTNSTLFQALKVYDPKGTSQAEGVPNANGLGPILSHEVMNFFQGVGELPPERDDPTAVPHGSFHLWLSYVSPGFVTDTERISEATVLDHRQIQELPVPSPAETQDVLTQLTSEEDPGIEFKDFMRLVGACRVCAQVVALSVFDRHSCVRGMYDFSLPRLPSLSPEPSSPGPSTYQYFDPSSTPAPATPTEFKREQSLTAASAGDVSESKENKRTQVKLEIEENKHDVIDLTDL